jgi:hypothetical protein
MRPGGMDDMKDRGMNGTVNTGTEEDVINAR